MKLYLGKEEMWESGWRGWHLGRSRKDTEIETMCMQPQNYDNYVFKTCALGTSQEFSWEMVSQGKEKDSVVKEVWESFLTLLPFASPENSWKYM